MATHAVVLTNAGDATASRLVRVLEFFGVPVVSLGAQELGVRTALGNREARNAIVASVEAFAAASSIPAATRALEDAKAIYLYVTADRVASERALRSIDGCGAATLRTAGGDRCSFSVAADLGELDGPM